MQGGVQGTGGLKRSGLLHLGLHQRRLLLLPRVLLLLLLPQLLLLHLRPEQLQARTTSGQKRAVIGRVELTQRTSSW